MGKRKGAPKENAAAEVSKPATEEPTINESAPVFSFGKPNTNQSAIAHATKFPDSVFQKFIYYKTHVVKAAHEQEDSEEGPARKKRGKGRGKPSQVLFVTNLTYDTTKEEVQKLFSNYGEVQSVKFGTTKTSDTLEHVAEQPVNPFTWVSPAVFCDGYYAHVSFASPNSTQKAMSVADAASDAAVKAPLFTENGSDKKGLEKYLEAYNSQICLDDTQQEISNINSWMREFDVELKRNQDMMKATANVTDDDGWIKVMPTSGRHAQGLRKDTTVLERMVHKVKMNSGEDLMLYRFQHKEQKRDKFAELRKKFDEDKARIEKMKSQRQFKPF